ncbi:smalltalk protein [Prevotellaceae bacterium LCP21S3_C11]
MSKIKADTWKTILQIAISFLTAIATTLGITSCVG